MVSSAGNTYDALVPGNLVNTSCATKICIPVGVGPNKFSETLSHADLGSCNMACGS